jgi:hypothetical protein
MALENDDQSALPTQELLKDPLYVKQHAETYRLAARELLGRYMNLTGEDFDAACALVSTELIRRREKYPHTYNTVATYRGLNSSSKDTWTAVDFAGDDAILGSNQNSVESKLRAQFPTVFEDLPEFVPPAE